MSMRVGRLGGLVAALGLVWACSGGGGTSDADARDVGDTFESDQAGDAPLPDLVDLEPADVAAPEPQGDAGEDQAGDGDEALADEWGIDTAQCQDPPVLPVPVGVVVGPEHDPDRAFTDSDLVFDGAGNLLFVDAAGNLLRVHEDGTREVWVERLVKRARGMAYLSTGELVIADSGLGRLVKVYENGEVRTLTEHLDYPNGVEVDRDDTLYVTEVSRSTITRVNPATGEARVVAQCSRTGLSGLAFSPDFQRLYAAGITDGKVYFTERAAGGEWGPLQVLAVLHGAETPCQGLVEGDACLVNTPGWEGGGDPGSETTEGACKADGFGGLICRIPDPCDDRVEGDACDLGDGLTGLCADDGAGGLYCTRPDPCDGKQLGDPCVQDWDSNPGICDGDGGVGLYCRPRQVCDDLSAGDPCTEYGVDGFCVLSVTGLLRCRTPSVCDLLAPGEPCEEVDLTGICIEVDDGTLSCQPIPACYGLAAGDSCHEYGSEGVCADAGDGTLYCQPVPPCDGKQAGDPCEEFGSTGECTDSGDGSLYCAPVPPCAGKSIGDECSSWDQAGTCQDDGTGSLFCRFPSPCDGLALGDPCTSANGFAGTCGQYPPDPNVYCVENVPCFGAALGDECITWSQVPGVCADDSWGGLYCQDPGPCDGLAAGDDCSDPYNGNAGTCTSAGSGTYCKAYNPCESLAVGDPCQTLWDASVAAACAVGTGGLPYCRPVEPCDGKQEGDGCALGSGWEGICVLDPGGFLYCQDASVPCFDGVVDAPCTTWEGWPGTCKEDEYGGFTCELAVPCDGRAAQDPCVDPYGSDGVCKALEGGTLACVPNMPCLGKSEGDACKTLGARSAGTCEVAAGGVLVCQPGPECEGMLAGDDCTTPSGVRGVCEDDGAGQLGCKSDVAVGRLHSLNTDGCGFLYVTDDATDSVWRFAPDGSAPVLVGKTRHGTVSGLAWGTGAGPWHAQSLFLCIGGGATILEIPVGLPARKLVHPHGTPALPPPPGEAPLFDCMNLPQQPASVTELEGPRGYHDVAFDSEGYLLGYDGFNLIRVDVEGHVQVVATGLGVIEGMDWLPDETLVVASEIGLTMVAPSGAQIPLSRDIRAYGVTVGPDGMVYAADNVRLYRADPLTQKVEILVDPAKFGESWLPRTIQFDVDHSLIYIGTLGSSVYVAPVDEGFNLLAKPHPFALVGAQATYLDGLGVDACGNVYIPNYETRALFRSEPDGLVSLYLQQEANLYGHGLEWGNGVGGWKGDALYLPQPYDSNGVVEVVVGIPGRP
jgi:sugar lactone lactonase YvrE